MPNINSWSFSKPLFPFFSFHFLLNSWIRLSRCQLELCNLPFDYVKEQIHPRIIFDYFQSEVCFASLIYKTTQSNSKFLQTVKRMWLVVSLMTTAFSWTQTGWGTLGGWAGKIMYITLKTRNCEMNIEFYLGHEDKLL